MGPEIEELEEYLEALNEIGAPKTAKTIKELIDWVNTDRSILPIDVVEMDEERMNKLWEQYNQCSVEEDPRKLVIEYQQRNKWEPVASGQRR